MEYSCCFLSLHFGQLRENADTLIHVSITFKESLVQRATRKTIATDKFSSQEAYENIKISLQE